MIKVLIFSCVFVTVLAKIITFKDCGTYSYDLDLAEKKRKKETVYENKYEFGKKQIIKPS